VFILLTDPHGTLSRINIHHISRYYQVRYADIDYQTVVVIDSVVTQVRETPEEIDIKIRRIIGMDAANSGVEREPR
jgi:hypothetical protein